MLQGIIRTLFVSLSWATWSHFASSNLAACWSILRSVIFLSTFWPYQWSTRIQIQYAFFYLLIMHAPLHCVILHAGYTFVCVIWFYIGNLSYYSGLDVVFHYRFSKSMEFMNCLNWVTYLFTRTHFCTGQSSSLDVDAISFSLSLSSFSQSNMRWSAVWSPLAQMHSGDSIVLNRCRYALVFPVCIC